MSDRMIPIPFDKLMAYAMTEYDRNGTAFGVAKTYRKTNESSYVIFGETMETAFGPAAGPHTQLAQNIIAAYFGGSRFFELKTVQTLDGEDLPVAKPCILADDECYNVEWSTELRVPQAMDEYIKAWFALKLLSKEYGLGSPNGFIFNMSVGYDLKGIQSEKINKFIEGLKNAEKTEIWAVCKKYALDNIDKFKNIDAKYVESISPRVCRSVTLSTLHGCPPQEIERIASYLIKEKKLNTFVKCNPTLLGYDYARATLDSMGYDYIVFDDFHFKDDLQYADAVPMLKRLIQLAGSRGLSFGVKLTNTFPVTIAAKELPGEEMYMSGKSLYPLSLSLAEKLSKTFNGKLKISYSGGADYFNIAELIDAGIWPVTLATTVLKPGGYARMKQIADKLELREKNAKIKFFGVNIAKVTALKEKALKDPHHKKALKTIESRKISKPIPLTDCFFAPCEQGCPINQDITAYIQLAGEGKYDEALRVITDKNPLPFMTGTICSHFCMGKCTRNFYEEPVNIRCVKLECAEKAYDTILQEIKQSAKPLDASQRTAVIGGGPAGIAAAYFLARAGIAVTVYEKREELGGTVKYVIPDFRITDEAILKDVELAKAMGAEFKTGARITSIEGLKNFGFKNIIVAVGAEKHTYADVQGAEVLNAIEFLESFNNGTVKSAKSFAVIGGGNTAMDAARAAKRVEGCEKVTLVYRRTKRYIAADEEELKMALDDGVELLELAVPESYSEGKLTCRKMKLGDYDAKGRRVPVKTDETVTIDAEVIIAAIGDKIDEQFFVENNVEIGGKIESNVENVYIAGDCVKGPATIVEAIRDAKLAVDNIIGKSCTSVIERNKDEKRAYSKKGILTHSGKCHESGRCLECSTVCENCVDVCPNRANVAIITENGKMPQIIHIDDMCNECGNCKSFCPYSGAPYLDKFTLFSSEATFLDSKNSGFFKLADNKFKVRLDGEITEFTLNEESNLPEGIKEIIKAVNDKYSYML